VKELVVILIIAHKQSLTENEKLSLIQCHKVLNKYPIKLICPEGLNISEYEKLIPDVQVEFIDPKWHSDYEMFNLLKIDTLLYEKFKYYQYILFYELDSWVFADELEYWCKKGYHFIGAPWFEGNYSGNSTTIIGVGNGGLSLRDTKSSILVLKRLNFLKKLRTFWFNSYLQSLWRFYKMVSLFNNYFHIDKTDELDTLLLLKYTMHEDRYWAKVAGAFTDYKIAPVEDAIKFSFEVQPNYLYKKNSERLPFGCHAWEKCEPEFWQAFIPHKNQTVIKDA